MSTSTITALSVWLPLPPMELSKNGRAHWTDRNELFQQYKRVAISNINRILPSGFEPWTGPVHIHIVWQQNNRGHWPDYGAVIERCAAFVDAAEIETAQSSGAGLFVNDRQVRSTVVDYVKSPDEGVQMTFKLGEGD